MSTSWRIFSGIEVRIVHHADERPFRLRGRTDAPIGFLVDIEPDDALNQREVLRNIGMISSIHFALSPPAWRTTFLQSGSAFFRCKERIDFLEHPLEALPAAVLCATVVPIHPGPIDVRMPRVIVHRGPIASIVIGDIRAPNPDYVGCAGGNEEIVNVSIGGDVEWGIVAAPGLVAVHLGGEVSASPRFRRQGLNPTRIDLGTPKL